MAAPSWRWTIPSNCFPCAPICNGFMSCQRSSPSASFTWATDAGSSIVESCRPRTSSTRKGRCSPTFSLTCVMVSDGSASTNSTPKGWIVPGIWIGSRSQSVRSDHAIPPRSTHRAKARKVARAEATISAVADPARTRPSSQARKRLHLAGVPSASPMKNEAPLPLATPSRSRSAGAITCPPRQAPSSTYKQPASSSGHDSGGRSAHRGRSAISRRDRPSDRRSLSISAVRARSGKPSGGPADATRAKPASMGA